MLQGHKCLLNAGLSPSPSHNCTSSQRTPVNGGTYRKDEGGRANSSWLLLWCCNMLPFARGHIGSMCCVSASYRVIQQLLQSQPPTPDHPTLPVIVAFLSAATDSAWWLQPLLLVDASVAVQLKKQQQKKPTAMSLNQFFMKERAAPWRAPRCTGTSHEDLHHCARSLLQVSLHPKAHIRAPANN